MLLRRAAREGSARWSRSFRRALCTDVAERPPHTARLRLKLGGVTTATVDEATAKSAFASAVSTHTDVPFEDITISGLQSDDGLTFTIEMRTADEASANEQGACVGVPVGVLMCAQ